MANTPLSPPPPTPAPKADEPEGFSSSPWQRWFSKLYTFCQGLQTQLLNPAGANDYANVTGSRLANTAYSSGANPLVISVTFGLSAVGDVVSIVCNGNNLSRAVCEVAGAKVFTLNAVIPPNSSYNASTTGAAVVNVWLEF